MTPDLGKYALWVLASYGVSLTLLAALVAASVLRARRVLQELKGMEAGRGASAPRPAAPVEGEPADG